MKEKSNKTWNSHTYNKFDNLPKEKTVSRAIIEGLFAQFHGVRFKQKVKKKKEGLNSHFSHLIRKV